MKYAILTPNDASFRELCLLMGAHPRYANMAFKRARDIDNVLRKGHVWAARDADGLKGALLWSEFALDVGLEAIRARKLPAPQLELPVGESIVVLGLIAPAQDEIRPFFEAFVADQRGKPVMYERSFTGRPPVFSWFDRDGLKDGPNI